MVFLFNHEGPRRGETFVTKKMQEKFQNYNTGKGCLYLGNLDAKRDWEALKTMLNACG